MVEGTRETAQYLPGDIMKVNVLGDTDNNEKVTGSQPETAESYLSRAIHL